MACTDSFSRLTVLELSADDKRTCLADIQRENGSPVLVIDLWHTKCTKCPTALSKLNQEAEGVNKSEVMYISIALSLGEGNYELTRDVIDGYECLILIALIICTNYVLIQIIMTLFHNLDNGIT